MANPDCKSRRLASNFSGLIKGDGGTIKFQILYIYLLDHLAKNIERTGNINLEKKNQSCAITLQSYI